MILTIIILNILFLLLDILYGYLLYHYRFTAIIKTTIPVWFMFQLLPLIFLLRICTVPNLPIFHRLLKINIITNLNIAIYLLSLSLGKIAIKMRLKLGMDGVTVGVALVDLED